MLPRGGGLRETTATPRAARAVRVDDGRDDVVVFAEQSNTIDVFLANADGSMGAPNAVPFDGVFMGAGTIADMNNDGFADLVVPDPFPGQGVFTYLNDGAGGFSAGAAGVSVGDRPGTARVANIDGDGVPDVITANRIAGTVSVLRGGMTGFTLVSVGQGPTALDLADADNDGDIDIAVANTDDSSVQVLFKDSTPGNVSISPGPAQGLGVTPGDLRFIDYNNDVLPDIAVLSTGSSQVRVHNNIGGAFGTVVLSLNGFQTFPSTFDVADANLDGGPDFLLANSAADEVTYASSDGAPGSYTLNAIFTPSPAVGVRFGDFNDDGAIDITYVRFFSDSLSVRLGDCALLPPVITQQPVSVVAAGGSAPLSFLVDATGAGGFQWRAGGVPLADGPGVSGATTNELVLNATPSNAAAIDVVVSNAAGQVVSDTAYLVIQPDPNQFPEDLDDSGVVDLPDLLQLLARFGQSEP